MDGGIAVASVLYEKERQDREETLNWLARQTMDNVRLSVNPAVQLYKLLGRHLEPPFWDDIQ